MGRGWEPSRRALFRSWLVALLGKAAAAGLPESGLDPVSFTLRGFAPTAVFQRRYRMDATILLMGAPVFTRQAAGGGYASVEISVPDESSTGQGATAIALQFAAGSSPARAHGLNRFGILREASVRRSDATEVSFAGLMTQSREESIEQGRKALASSTLGAEAVVARGRTYGSTIQSWIDIIDLAPGCNWVNLNETLCDALRREPRSVARETVAPASATFLHAMRSAALSKDAVYLSQFTHAGKGYWLETRRRSERPLELAGTIHDQAGKRCAEFRTAYAPGDHGGIPIRIEYRPRSFLRLTFEAEPEANQPPIPSVFHQEAA